MKDIARFLRIQHSRAIAEINERDSFDQIKQCREMIAELRTLERVLLQKQRDRVRQLQRDGASWEEIKQRANVTDPYLTKLIRGESRVKDEGVQVSHPEN